MNTLNENLNSNSKLITINKRPYSKIADFIAEYDGKKYIKIYTPKMYPLLLAKDDEEFVIIANEYENYIFRSVNNSIKTIYSSNAKKILEATDKQSIVLLPQESNKFLLQSFKKKNNSIIERLDNTLIVAIYEEGKKAKLFDISKNEYILESSYINTLFFQNTDYILEKSNNKIKAIYYFNGILALKSDENFLKIIDKIYVEEIYSDGKCHSIYVKHPKYYAFNKIITDYIFDLCILNSQCSNDYYNYTLILRKIGEKCKALFLYNLKKQCILKSSPILNSDDKHYEILFTGYSFYIKVMVNKNCIEILDSNFTSIVSLNENEEDISNTSFERIHFSDKNFFIKIFNKKCIAIYDNIEYNLCSITENKDIDIVLFKGYKTILFMHKLNNEYIKIEGKNLPTLSSCIFEPVIENEKVIAIYGIKNGKKVAIYNFELNKVVSYEDFEDVSLEIAFSYIKEYIDRSEYCEDVILYQHMSFLKYDKDGKCRKIYNEKNIPILVSQENNHFKLYNEFILEYHDDKCIAIFEYSKYIHKNWKNILEISSNTCEFLLNTTSSNHIFVEEYDYTTKKKLNLYTYSSNGFNKIFSDYDNVTELNDYFIIFKNNSNTLQLIKIDDSKIISLSPNHGGTLKITSDSLNQIYAYELDDNKKIISIYYLNGEKFINTITSEDGIEIVKIDNFDFFKVKDKIYNLLGYEV